jgi:hypothetical protein
MTFPLNTDAALMAQGAVSRGRGGTKDDDTQDRTGEIVIDDHTEDATDDPDE